MTTTLLASFPSPAQGVWHLGFIPLRAYALFILIGVIAALFIGNKRWSDRGGEPGVIFDIALWAILFGLAGGRLYHVLTDWTTYFGPGGAGLMAAFKIQEGGLGIWGAVALGGVGAWIGCRRKGIPLPAFGDAIAPGIVLAQAIGRIGNYFNQELYGRTTSLPWGLEIFERRDAHGALDSLNGVSTGQLIEIVHPTFLYELLWNLLVFALLIWVDRRYRIGHGRLFALYVAAYCFGRFWIELMRSDMATHIAGIRINSFVSVFVFIGAVVYIMVAPKGREDPTELRGDVAVEEVRVRREENRLPRSSQGTGGRRGDDRRGGSGEGCGRKGRRRRRGWEVVADEAEQLVADLESAPAEDIAEAEAFAEAGEEADATEAIGGLGAVEGDEVVEAEEAAPEVHEAAVEGADEAAEAADEAAEADEDAPSEAEVVGGLGAVEGDEVAEAEDAAAEVHEAAVEGAEDAAEAADEVAAETQDDSAEPLDQGEDAESVEPEPEAIGGVGAVEGDEVVEAQEAAPEVHGAAVENAEEAADVADEVSEDASDEPESGSSEGEDAEDEGEQAVEEAVDESDSDGETGAAVEAAEAADEVSEDASDEPESGTSEGEDGEDQGEQAVEEAADESDSDGETGGAAVKDAEEAAEAADELSEDASDRARVWELPKVKTARIKASNRQRKQSTNQIRTAKAGPPAAWVRSKVTRRPRRRRSHRRCTRPPPDADSDSEEGETPNNSFVHLPQAMWKSRSSGRASMAVIVLRS